MQSVYSGLRHRDLQPLLEVLDDAVEFVNPPTAVEPGTRRGKAAFERAHRGLYEAIEVSQMDVERLSETGEKVVAVLRVLGRGRVSGAPVEYRTGHVFTFARGKLVRFEWFFDPVEALEAVGLLD